MYTCKTCKYWDEKGSEADKAWCLVWKEWQKGTASQCAYYEQTAKLALKQETMKKSAR